MSYSQRQQTEQWKQLLEKSHAEFRASNLSQFKLVEFAQFTQYLQDLNHRYERQGWSRFINRFHSRLEHIRSFERAVAAMSQVNDTSSFLWGGIQILLEGAIRHASLTEEIFNLLTDLADSLPYFEDTVKLYPDEPALQWPLRDMFSEFATFCLKISQYLTRNPARNFLGVLLSSTPEKTLKRTQVLITKHRDQFDREFTLLHRRDVRRAALMVPGSQKDSGHNATMDASQPDSPDSIALSVRFPVETGRPMRNFAFHGRQDAMQEIDDVFSKSFVTPDGPQRPDSCCCVIHGIAGVGKTQTALAYTYAFGHRFQAIFWLQAETTVRLTESFGLIAPKLKLQRLLTPQSSYNSSNSSESDVFLSRVDLAREWLERTDKPWLIIFDNVEYITPIDAFIPRNSTRPGCILITTQHPDTKQLSSVFHRLYLSSFDPRNGAELLYRYLSRDPEDSAEGLVASEISQFVGGLPLAIAVMGGYINSSGITLSEFLVHLKRSSRLWSRHLNRNYVQDYDYTLGAVFDLAISELGEQPLKLIYLLAYLNPDGIPEEMLVTSHKDKSLEFLNDPSNFMFVIKDLRMRQLVKRERSGSNSFHLSIHRTTQLCILNTISEDVHHRKRVFDQAFNAVKQQLPEPSRIRAPQPEASGRYQTYIPHILSVHGHSVWPEPPVDLPVDFAKTIAECGTFMWHNRQFLDGEKALLASKDILRSHNYDSMDPLYGDINSTLASMYDLIGVSRRKESSQLRASAFEIRAKEWAAIPSLSRTTDDHIRFIASKSSMAGHLLHADDAAKSEESLALMEVCLEAYKLWGTEQEVPFEYAKYYLGTAVALAQLGRIREGIERAEHSCQLMIAHSGPFGHLTLMHHFTLGNLYYLSGNTGRALIINEEVLDNRRKVSGETSMETLESYSMTGYLYFRAGRLADAKSHIVKCLELSSKHNWCDEGIATVRHRLSEVLHALGEIDEAKRQHDLAAAARREFLQRYPEYLKSDKILSSSDFDILNRTVQDAVWGHIDIEPRNGFVAIDGDHTIAQELPHSQGWTWDSNRGVYIMTSSHERHCVLINQLLKTVFRLRLTLAQRHIVGQIVVQTVSRLATAALANTPCLSRLTKSNSKKSHFASSLAKNLEAQKQKSQQNAVVFQAQPLSDKRLVAPKTQKERDRLMEAWNDWRLRDFLLAYVKHSARKRPCLGSKEYAKVQGMKSASSVESIWAALVRAANTSVLQRKRVEDPANESKWTLSRKAAGRGCSYSTLRKIDMWISGELSDLHNLTLEQTFEKKEITPNNVMTCVAFHTAVLIAAIGGFRPGVFMWLKYKQVRFKLLQDPRDPSKRQLVATIQIRHNKQKNHIIQHSQHRTLSFCVTTIPCKPLCLVRLLIARALVDRAFETDFQSLDDILTRPLLDKTGSLPLHWAEGIEDKPIIPLNYATYLDIWARTLTVAGLRDKNQRPYLLRVGAGGRLSGSLTEPLRNFVLGNTEDVFLKSYQPHRLSHDLVQIAFGEHAGAGDADLFEALRHSLLQRDPDAPIYISEQDLQAFEERQDMRDLRCAYRETVAESSSDSPAAKKIAAKILWIRRTLSKTRLLDMRKAYFQEVDRLRARGEAPPRPANHGLNPSKLFDPKGAVAAEAIGEFMRSEQGQRGDALELVGLYVPLLKRCPADVTTLLDLYKGVQPKEEASPFYEPGSSHIKSCHGREHTPNPPTGLTSRPDASWMKNTPFYPLPAGQEGCCLVCGNVFKNAGAFATHFKVQHMQKQKLFESPFDCFKCVRQQIKSCRLDSAADWQAHLEEAHQGGGVYGRLHAILSPRRQTGSPVESSQAEQAERCLICNKIFRNAGAFTTHFRVYHIEERGFFSSPFDCPECVRQQIKPCRLDSAADWQAHLEEAHQGGGVYGKRHTLLPPRKKRCQTEFLDVHRDSSSIAVGPTPKKPRSAKQHDWGTFSPATSVQADHSAQLLPEPDRSLIDPQLFKECKQENITSP
ncbi:hypothetical protein F4678DRAFT_485319 [Xylaria arbuscula]|nr:hypothetical protein F4678DRAFT_485319 [Xylaria arbuscula]